MVVVMVHQRGTVQIKFLCLRFGQVRQLVFLLPLHPPVLKPDFDLSFCEVQGVSDLNAPPPGQVAVEVELLLQLQGLVAGVASARALVLHAVHAICWQKNRQWQKKNWSF